MPSPEATIGVTRWPPLVAPAMAAAAGIVVDRRWPLAAEIWWLLAASAALMWWLAFRRRHRGAATSLLLVSTALAAAAWGHDRWHRFPQDEIGRFTAPEPQPAAMRLTALSEPIWVPAPPPSALRTGPQGDESELQVRLTHLRQGSRWQAVSGEAKLTVQGHLLGVRAGDQLLAYVDLVEPSPPMNPGGFDYAAWLRKDRELAELRAGFPDCVRVVASARDGPAGLLARVRSAGNAALWKHIGEERGALAATLLLNDREQLDRRRRDSFFHTGTIHLLAISECMWRSSSASLRY
jgi:competence protein ComEC